eukprot:gene13557-16026_t
MDPVDIACDTHAEQACPAETSPSACNETYMDVENGTPDASMDIEIDALDNSISAHAIVSAAPGDNTGADIPSLAKQCPDATRELTRSCDCKLGEVVPTGKSIPTHDCVPLEKWNGWRKICGDDPLRDVECRDPATTGRVTVPVRKYFHQKQDAMLKEADELNHAFCMAFDRHTMPYYDRHKARFVHVPRSNGVWEDVPKTIKQYKSFPTYREYMEFEREYLPRAGQRVGYELVREDRPCRSHMDFDNKVPRDSLLFERNPIKYRRALNLLHVTCVKVIVNDEEYIAGICPQGSSLDIRFVDGGNRDLPDGAGYRFSVHTIIPGHRLKNNQVDVAYVRDSIIACAVMYNHLGSKLPGSMAPSNDLSEDCAYIQAFCNLSTVPLHEAVRTAYASEISKVYADRRDDNATYKQVSDILPWYDTICTTFQVEYGTDVSDLFDALVGENVTAKDLENNVTGVRIEAVIAVLAGVEKTVADLVDHIQTTNRPFRLPGHTKIGQERNAKPIVAFDNEDTEVAEEDYHKYTATGELDENREPLLPIHHTSQFKTWCDLVGVGAMNKKYSLFSSSAIDRIRRKYDGTTNTTRRTKNGRTQIPETVDRVRATGETVFMGSRGFNDALMGPDSFASCKRGDFAWSPNDSEHEDTGRVAVRVFKPNKKIPNEALDRAIAHGHKCGHRFFLGYEFSYSTRDGTRRPGRVFASFPDATSFWADFESSMLPGRLVHWHEIFVAKVRFFVDIEWYVLPHDDHTRAQMEMSDAFARNLLNAFTRVADEKLLREFRLEKSRPEGWSWRVSDASGAEKRSFHVILIGGGYFHDAEDVKNIMQTNIIPAFKNNPNYTDFCDVRPNADATTPRGVPFDFAPYSTNKSLRMLLSEKIDNRTGLVAPDRSFKPFVLGDGDDAELRRYHLSDLSTHGPEYTVTHLTSEELRRPSEKARVGPARAGQSGASKSSIAPGMRDECVIILREMARAADGRNIATMKLYEDELNDRLRMDYNPGKGGNPPYIYIPTLSKRCCVDRVDHKSQHVYMRFLADEVRIACHGHELQKHVVRIPYPTHEIRTKAMTLLRGIERATHSSQTTGVVGSSSGATAPEPARTQEVRLETQSNDNDEERGGNDAYVTVRDSADAHATASHRRFRSSELVHTPEHQHVADTAIIVDKLLAHTASARDIWVAEIKPVIASVAKIAAGVEGLFPEARKLVGNSVDDIERFRTLWTATRNRADLGINYLRDVCKRCDEEAEKAQRSDSEQFAPLDDTGEEEVTQDIRNRYQLSRDQLELNSYAMADKTPASRIYKLTPEDVVGGVLKRERDDAPEQVTDVLRFLNSGKRCPDSCAALSFRVDKEGKYTVSCRQSDCNLCPKNLRPFSPCVINLIYSPQVTNVTTNNYKLVESHVASAHLLPKKILEEYNNKYATVLHGGKMVVGFLKNPAKTPMRFVTFRTFKEMLQREYSKVQDGFYRDYTTGELTDRPKYEYVNHADAWLHNAKSNKYDCARFLPGDTSAKDRGILNLWQGWGVEPSAEGDCSLFWDLVKDLCGDCDALFQYVQKWMAHMFQKPMEKPGTALLFGAKEEGVGLDTMVEMLSKCIGLSHFFTGTRTQDLTSHFNGAMCDSLLVFLNESGFAGNHEATTAFKGMVTNVRTGKTNKGKDTEFTDTFYRVIKGTNEKRVAQVTGRARRDYCMQPIGKYLGDRSWFSRLRQQMESNAELGLRRLLHELLYEIDITNFDTGAPPVSEALESARWEQRRLSFKPVEDFVHWWLDVPLADFRAQNPITSEKLYSIFKCYYGHLPTAAYITAKTFGKEFNEILIGTTKAPRLVDGARVMEVNIK